MGSVWSALLVGGLAVLLGQWLARGPRWDENIGKLVALLSILAEPAGADGELCTNVVPMGEIPTDMFYFKLVASLIAILFLLIGCGCGFFVGYFFKKGAAMIEEKPTVEKKSRTIAVQSQTTYTFKASRPRFTPL